MAPPLRVVRDGLLPPSSFHHLVQLGHRLVQLSLGRVILCQHVLVFVYNRSSEEPFASDIRSGKSRQRDKKGGRGGKGRRSHIRGNRTFQLFVGFLQVGHLAFECLDIGRGLQAHQSHQSHTIRTVPGVSTSL